MKYKIYNEDGELMRMTRTKQEAVAICAIREGWTFVYIKPVKPVYEPCLM